MSNKEKILIGLSVIVSIVSIVAMCIFLPVELTIISLGFTAILTLITFLFFKKQEKESSKLKIGDIVSISGLTNDGEILEVDDTHAVIKTRISKMKLSIKK